MKVLGVGNPRHRRSILQPQSSPNRNFDSLACQPNQLGERRGSSDDVRLSPRGEQSIRSRGDHVFESLLQRWGRIEGAMKGDLQRPRKSNQRVRSRHIDLPTRLQDTQDHARCTQLLDVQNVSPHNVDLRC